ncbi:MAG: hypothetical protein ACRDOU_21245 [Streptosporangiaceae bacterium]
MTEQSQAPPEGTTMGAPAGISQPQDQADQNAPQPDSGAISLAVEIGWSMAVLYRMAQSTSASTASVTDRLPTEHELSPADRKALEEIRVNAALARLGGLLPPSPSAQPGVPQVQLASGPETPAAQSDTDILTQANLQILEWLAGAGRDYGIAYQLGRSLRDTTDPLPPAGGPAVDALLAQLSRTRVAVIQDWLSTLLPYLPTNSATIVSVSIGRWSDVVTAIFDKSAPGRLRAGQSKADVAGTLTKSLLPQGDAWINLLVGAESSQGLLTPEGYVAAGEAAFSRSARVVKKLAGHYWWVLLILAIVLGAFLYFAASGLRGAGRAWTQIFAVLSVITAAVRGAVTAVARFSGQAEKPLFGLEEIDAMAWAVTTLPTGLKLNFSGVRALRRAGIPGSGPMGGT